MQLFDLSGKVALITGSTKGIGKAIAEAMAAAGATVVINSRKAAVCDAVAAEIQRAGGKAVAIPANISDDAALEGLVAETLERCGKIDSLVCNAAVNPYYGPFLDIPDEALEKTVRVNIRANMRLAKLATPSMIASGGGSIIIVSSIAAFTGSDHLGMYAVTKAADVQIIRNLAVAYGRHNIRANGVAPGLVKTDFAKALWEDPARAEKVAAGYALKRLGEPQDIAGAAVFLAAPASAWMSGQTMIVDGGWQCSGEAY